MENKYEDLDHFIKRFKECKTEEEKLKYRNLIVNILDSEVENWIIYKV